MRKLILEEGEGTDHEFLRAFKALPMYPCRHCQQPILFNRFTPMTHRVCADCRFKRRTFKNQPWRANQPQYPDWAYEFGHSWGGRYVYATPPAERVYNFQAPE